HRLVRRTNAREMLIYTDGSCYGHKDRNGISQRRGGCAFIFKPSPYNLQEKSCSFRLERLGPTGVEYPQTSNRAKLRAVIAALQFRVWRGEHFKSIVIGTDSEYVVLGITDLIETWAQTEWQTFGGTTVKNKDLWKLLLVEINKLAKEGCEVHFWLLPIHHNEEADWLAKEATTEPDVPKYLKYFGALV
ncbi:ribonuclease H-like protein, partial [Lophium mytilinum]